MQSSPGSSTGIHGQYQTPTHPTHPTHPPAAGAPNFQQQGVLQTPNFGMTLGGAVLRPEVEFSGKHNGLCRYLARLLRPLWNERIVVSQLPTRTEPEEQVRTKGERREVKGEG